jgi:predicted RecA/RadA family phage recombinase
VKNFIQDGNVIEVTAPRALSSGDGVLVGGLFGIATGNANPGDRVNIKMRGLFNVKKNNAEAWATVGLPIYWDDTNHVFTIASTGNTLVAHNTDTAANPSATGNVLLDR